MASLAERENLSGKCQMIYFDPPYGIGFKSNFQVSVRNRETPTGRKGLPNDPRTIRAFRDSYSRGVHSYLDQVCEKLTLCRELLAESGSIFVQIGDENVHRMAIVLDEVFGHENRVATIPFATTSGSSSKTLPSVADFLLWYAKEKPQVKYRQLYEPLNRAEKIQLMSSYVMIELADGANRKLTDEERRDPDKCIPEGARLYRRVGLISSGTSTTGRSEPYHWGVKGRSIDCPVGSQWSVSMEGMDRLDELSRLDQASPQSALMWKKYENEVPGRRINNIWQRQRYSSDKRYVVQTADSVIERCILMTTDPGDLVFDPTCGGATTALAAEKWGRRWITCDTSPISVAIARQRIATATFKYWTLADSPEGAKAEAEFSNRPVSDPPSGGYRRDPARGFVYERVPKVSAAILAYDLDVDPTLLVDRPHITRGITRMASPFTVESSSPWSYVPVDNSAASPVTPTPVAYSEFAEIVIEALKSSPIRSTRADTGDIRVSEIEPWPGRRGLISHLLRYTVGRSGAEHRAGLLIAPEDATVTAAMLRAAALDAAASIDGAELVIVVAFAFEPDTSVESIGRVKVIRAQMHRDLQIRDLKDDAAHQAFVMVGQPDIEIYEEPGGQVSVKLFGYDTYNPATGQLTAGSAETDVACWMIDTEYDSASFFARRIHFPGANNDKQMKRLYKALGRTLHKLRWNRALSLRSAPFPKPPPGVAGQPGQIAVKIITATGNEMSVVAEVP